jgi:hypothetical protein
MIKCKDCKNPKKSMEYCNECLAENNPEMWELLTKQFALTM